MNESTQRYRVFAEWGEGLAGASKTVGPCSEEQAMEAARSCYPGAQVSVMPSEAWMREHAMLQRAIDQRRGSQR